MVKAGIHVLLLALTYCFIPGATQVLWPQYNRSDSSLTWEYNPAENFTAMYYFRMNEDNETEFVEEYSKLEKPLKWFFKLVRCKLEKTRCKRPQRSLRALQETPENYIRVLFGDNEGPGVPEDAKSIFQQAAETWSNVILENRLLPSSLILNTAPGGQMNIGVGCGIPESEDTFTVETSANPVEPVQLTILAQVRPIDGPGGTLAQAGPCLVGDDVNGRRQSYLGIMTFDTPDFNSQLENDAQALFNTVLHEMGHILGIGTLWRPEFLENPVFGFGAPNFNNQPVFTGPNAAEANNELTQIGASQVFVENSGGQGTADAHWEETVYRNELMTGFLNPGDNPMSVLTIASLIDIGLAADLCVAQDFAGSVVNPEGEGCANRTFIGYEGTGGGAPTGSNPAELTPGQIAGIAVAGVLVLVAIGLLCNGLWGLIGESDSPQKSHSGAKAYAAEKQTAEGFTNNTGVPVQGEQNQTINLS